MIPSTAIETDAGPLTLAIIGAGQAGRSLAAEAVRAGYRVYLEDVLPSRLRDALGEIPTQGMRGSLEIATEVENAVRNADLVIDFVPDELESKLEIVSLIDRMAPPRTVLCVPTVTLQIRDLAACTYRAAMCVGMRWSEDAILLDIGTEATDEAILLVEKFWSSLGRQVHREPRP